MIDNFYHLKNGIVM